MQSIIRILKPASLLCASLLAAAACAPQAVAAGAFDGRWSVTIGVKGGECVARTVQIQVSDGRVRYPGKFRAEATGKVSQTGSLNLRFSRKQHVAQATGKLAGTSGRGRWVSPTKGCSGVWSARRA